MYIVQCIDYIGYSTHTLCAVCEDCSVFAIHYKYLPKTKKFGCVGRGDLTSLFFSKVVKY